MTELIGSTVLGYPRIGPRRELKKALESYWAGTIDEAALHDVARDLRANTWRELRDAGLDSIPGNTFSYYDQVLDTTVMLGALPERFTSLGLSSLDTYFAATRGVADTPPLELTKWFDTNYHYLVPELGPDTQFRLNPAKPLAEFREALALGIQTRPVLIGPVSFLLLSKSDGRFTPLDLLDGLLAQYAELLRELADAGAGWVQLDEPAFVADRTPDELKALLRAYSQLGSLSERPKLLVASYFGDLGPALPALASTPVEAIGVDLVAGGPVTGVEDKIVVAGVVDGRNVWRTDLDKALSALRSVTAAEVAVSSSSSLLHVPYDVDVETALDPRVRSWLAFARQKVDEIVLLGRVLRGDAEVPDESRERIAEHHAAPELNDPAVRSRLAALGSDDLRRGEYSRRARLQAEALALPSLPTTTIGSFPQTADVRAARAALRTGMLDADAYQQRMRAEIENVIRLQEKLGLDVLVHGEPERNDMVQYFADFLTGFASTELGWVQSYGSRCVRPPIIYGDVSRTQPMTVEWATYAQSLTSKPVKGMLTGPVTILAWSFVRDDQPLADTARQVALAIRDETVDLETAGITVIQVDEPALRELLPLRVEDRPSYLAWSVEAFRLATSGVSDATQVHTHLCYSEFGDVIGAINELDADVTSIEAARSKMEVLADLAAIGFDRGVGPGVYDIHSPRVPSSEELSSLVAAALKSVPADRLWINPDCGLKTRGYAEVEPSLANMVSAALAAR